MVKEFNYPCILISNIGFGQANPKSLERLKKHARVIENTNGKRFTEEDFFRNAQEADIIIAGTEKITKSVIENAKKLKLIARVGVGLDSIDLEAAQKCDIKICYTPDAPSVGVPEFTLALILNLLKGISAADRDMHAKKWNKTLGRSLANARINILGAGKIGSEVIRLISLLSPNTIIGFFDPFVDFVPCAQKLSFEDLFKDVDIVSLHLPLNDQTYKVVSHPQLSSMPRGSYLINTSRGGIVDEEALFDALNNNLAGAAIDVFEKEPYSGRLCSLNNCLLTPHLGSMSLDARKLMEDQVSKDVINFINGKSFSNPYSYENR